MKIIAWSIVSLLYGYSCVIGKMLNENGSLNFQSPFLWLAPLFAAPVAGIILAFLINKLGQLNSLRAENSKIKINNENSAAMSAKECAIISILLFICWGIVLLGVYPGFFNCDAGDEVLEVITRNFSTHHPMLHVLYLGGIVQAGKKIFGTYNAGIFLFTLFQMCLHIAAVTYAFRKLSCLGVSKLFCRCFAVIFALFPVYPMFVLCSTKDSIFSLTLMLCILFLYEWQQTGNVKTLLWASVWAVAVCMFRNNAVYALILTGIIVLASLKIIKSVRKDAFKQILTAVAGVVLVTVLATRLLVFVFDADDYENQELLTVPIQQLARAYTYHRELFDEEDLEMLYSYIPEEYIDKYRPKLSDPVKVGFLNEIYNGDKASFWKLWLKMLKKAPMTYVNGWLLTNYGFWYVDADIDVYTGNSVYTFTYENNSYFAYETEYPGARDSKLPAIDEFYRKLSLEKYKENIPVVSWMFSPGMILWVWVFAMVFIWLEKGVKSALVFVFPFMIFATLLLGPTYLPRYVFYLWYCLPLILCVFSNKQRS